MKERKNQKVAKAKTMKEWRMTLGVWEIENSIKILGMGEKKWMPWRKKAVVTRFWVAYSEVGQHLRPDLSS